MRQVYMCLVNEFSGCVFVKEREFFESQGGFREDWGKNWQPIVSDSIEGAREAACEKLPSARPYAEQAK